MNGSLHTLRRAAAAGLALLALSGALAASPPSSERVVADLRQVAETALAVHPALAAAPAREAFRANLKRVEALAPDVRTAGDEAVLVDLALRPLDDPHSVADLATDASAVLPVAFSWVSNGLVASPLSGLGIAMPPVAEVTRLGGMTPPELLSRLHQLLPGNAAWLRDSGARVLGLRAVLRWLGALGADGTVRIDFRTPSGNAGSVDVTPLPRSELAGHSPPLHAVLQEAVGMTRKDWQRGATYLWRYDPSTRTAVFWLLACVDSRGYRNAVETFFQTAAKEGAARVVLDLRYDHGGDSRVMDAFLAHLPAREVRSYAVSVRASAAVQRLRGLDRAALARQAVGRDANGLYVLSRPGEARASVPARPPVFHGPVYVVTGPGTFSSAGMFAVTLHDNGLATVVGEAPGAEPSGYGDVLRFQTGLGVPYDLSFKRFTRPAPGAAGAPSLTPQVALPLTVADVFAGTDPVAAWLASLGN